MSTSLHPLLTANECARLTAARDAGVTALECSLDLQRTVTRVVLHADGWNWRGQIYPYPARYKKRTVYYWSGSEFAPVARYSGALIKLIPTDWGAPTFEIDGIKMLPTLRTSPHADAERKVALIQPRGKCVLDTCGGLGYFADWCIQGQARHVRSYEKNPDVIWLRGINPWSPREGGVLELTEADVSIAIQALPGHSFDAVLHDPPRFAIAGELYSLRFYQHLARVLIPKGRLFHYTGRPNALTTGRDVPREVMKRLRQAGFAGERQMDGVLAIKR